MSPTRRRDENGRRAFSSASIESAAAVAALSAAVVMQEHSLFVGIIAGLGAGLLIGALKLITLLPEDVHFDHSWLIERLSAHGVDDQRQIESALATLELYALLKKDGGQLHFVMSHFPRAVRRLDLDRQIAAQLVELEHEQART